MMKNRQPDGCREVLKLKIAIVTGASSGMGREFALQIPQLYKNLDELWVVARRTDRLKSLKEQVKDPGQDLRRGYAERLYFRKTAKRTGSPAGRCKDACKCGRIWKRSVTSVTLI